MSKDTGNEHKSGSAIVDLYNLELSEDPQQDVPKIEEFFEKHALHVLDQYSSPPRWGTLKWYWQHYGTSWFDSEHAKPFYDWWQKTQQLVNLYLETKVIPIELLNWFRLLPKGVHVIARVKAGDLKLEITRFPKGIKPGQELHGEEISFCETLGYDPSFYSDTEIDLGRIKYNLFKDFLSLFNGELLLGKCALNGCGRIFLIGSGRYRKKYCSNSHRVLAYQRRKAEAAS